MQQAPAAICAQGSAPLADPNELACTFNSKSRPSRTFHLDKDNTPSPPSVGAGALQCNRETPL